MLNMKDASVVPADNVDFEKEKKLIYDRYFQKATLLLGPYFCFHCVRELCVYLAAVRFLSRSLCSKV